MKLRSSAWGGIALLSTLLFGGCNHQAIPSTGPVPSPQVHRSLPERGLYTTSDRLVPGVFGYSDPNKHNDPPVCKIRGPYQVQGMGVDFKGNLIVPSSGNDSIGVYRGPDLCGRWIKTLHDPFGNPVDAASDDATGGTIVIADIKDYNNTTSGSLILCTLAKGCTTRLTNPAMNTVLAVALARNGDCWALGGRAFIPLNLVYFKRCSGSGKKATGFAARFAGTMDIDSHGNLVIVTRCCTAVAPTTTRIDIYRGCDPACVRVGGPFSTNRGGAQCGRLNKDSTELAIANPSRKTVDIYRYSTTSLKHITSFSTRNRMTCIAVLPRSIE